MGEEGRSETLLEGCAYFLVQCTTEVLHILVIYIRCIGSSGTMRPALFGRYWYCCCGTIIGRFPRHGTVQEIVYVCRVRALEHDRDRNYEKIIPFHRDLQSLLQIRSRMVLRKAHVVLHGLGVL